MIKFLIFLIIFFYKIIIIEVQWSIYQIKALVMLIKNMRKLLLFTFIMMEIFNVEHNDLKIFRRYSSLTIKSANIV